MMVQEPPPDRYAVGEVLICNKGLTWVCLGRMANGNWYFHQSMNRAKRFPYPSGLYHAKSTQWLDTKFPYKGA